MSQSSAISGPLEAIDGDAYRLIFDHSPQPMWVFDEETLAFVEVNRAAVAAYGYSRDEFLRMDITQIRPPEDIVPLLQRIREGAAAPARTWKHVTKGGGVIDVEVVSNRITIGGRRVRLAVIRDVSEHKKLEEQLRQAQKIETVGQLAGGIAHDFSNLLTAIIGHTDLLAEYFAPTDPRAMEIAGIRNAADLAATLTKQLLAFSRTQVLQPMLLDLNEVIGKTRGILGRLIGDHIELVTDLGAALLSVRADRVQVEQILLNLAINARDAMADGGRLTLGTRNERVDRESGRQLGLDEGDYVVLSVADTGLGIDAAASTHLFEPFFTTKAPARGTGLGLATVYGIVKQSGGHVTVESEPGRGTTFAVYLPGTAETADCHRLPELDAIKSEHATVLLVADDTAVRGLINDVLGRRGYRLLVAKGMTHAIALASEHQGPIDLLITDGVTSGKNSPPIAEAVRAARPAIKVLYVSGYTANVTMPSGFMETSGVFLHKPFTPDALARKVRAILTNPV